MGLADALRERAHGPALWAALGALALAASAAADSARLATVEMLEDAAARLTAEEAAGDPGFRPLPGARLNAGYSRSAFWLRLELPAAAAAGERIVVEVAAPVLDRVEAFARVDGPWRLLGAAGDGVAFSARALPHRQPAFAIALAPMPTTVLVRLASEGSLTAPVRVWSEGGFHANAATDNLFFGCYFGFLAAMLIYNLFLFASIRDRAYLWYVAYVAALMLLQAKLAGYADQYLWPDAPALANPANLLAFAAVVVCGAQFTRSFLRRAPSARWARRLIVAGQVSAAAAASLLLVASYRLATQVLLAVTVGVIAVLVAAMVKAYRGGYRPARFILLAFAALAVGAAAMILRQFGAVGFDFPAERVFDAATAAEALLLSFALGDRINALEAERRGVEAALDALQERLPGALLEAQDREREHMAAELHDAVGQNLVVVGSRIRALAASPRYGSDASPALTEIADINRETLDQVRTMARSLHPAELDRLGLARAIRMMAERATAESGLDFHAALGATGDDLPPDRRLQLYRIAQEAVTNAVKHSRARRLTVAFGAERGRVYLAVADDGTGFDPAAVGASMGLATMRQRSAMLNASFAVETAPGAGTVIRVLVPLPGAS